MKPTDLDMSARILYEEAQKRGISCTLFPPDKNLILMQDEKKQWYTYGSRTSLQSSVGRTISNSKLLTKLVLRNQNLPSARGFIPSEKTLDQQFSQLTPPLVVKPESGAHGRDIHTGVSTLDEVKNILQKKTSHYIVEEQLEGIEYRVVCVDYVFVAASFRKPAHVIGDGKSSIEELVAQKNSHPLRGEGHSNILTKISLDQDALALLETQGFSLTSVPPLDHEVLLRTTANLSTGGEAWDATDLVSEENKKIFEAIARACDLNTIGIDIICQNLSQPIHEQKKAGVIEVNGSPGLRMHHYPMSGEVRNVAKAILDMVDRG